MLPQKSVSSKLMPPAGDRQQQNCEFNENKTANGKESNVENLKASTPVVSDSMSTKILTKNSVHTNHDEDELALVLTAETSSTTGTGTDGDDNSTTGGKTACEDDEERWLQLELEMLERMSVRTQTVEEIMAEKNDFLPLDEDELLGPSFSNGGVENIEYDGCSSAAATAFGIQLPPMGRYGAIYTELPCSYELSSPLLVHKEDAISEEIYSGVLPHKHAYSIAVSISDHGQPTAICVGQNLIAVGTSLGHCYLFEKIAQRLINVITTHDAKFGSVSCMDFSLDQNRLCIGYSMGALMVVGCPTNGVASKIYFRSDDVVQPGRGILHVKYILRNSLLLVDNGGNVYEFHERPRRQLGKQKKESNVRCLFTGCQGEVVNLDYIHSNSIELLVLVTFHQALLLSVKRRGAMVGQIRLHGSALHPPLIAWRERKMRVTSHSIICDLRLCIARDCEARIYQVRQRVGGDLMFPLLQVLHFEHSLINLQWIEDWALLSVSVKNGSEQLQLIELQQQQQTQSAAEQKKNSNNVQTVIPTAVADIAEQVKLIYNSTDFKGMATGQNVSKAMRSLANYVCYHSITKYFTDDQIYLLGRGGVFCVQLIEQIEQLTELVKRSDFASALLFSIDICTGQVQDRSKRGAASFRLRAFKEIPTLVERLLEKTIDGLERGRIDELIAHYKRNIYVLLRSCVVTSHFDLLYNTLYPRLRMDPLCRSIVLELLEEFVLEGQLDQPPPTIVNDYLEYLLTEGQLPQFEQSVTKLPVESMNLHQVIVTCRENQLFDGICYVMNNAMRDYISPLQEMFENIQRFVHKEVLSDEEIAQGNKLLLYLSCCLAGRAYPYGELPDEHMMQTVPLETYKFLVQLRPSFTIAPPQSPTLIDASSINTEANDDERRNENNATKSLDLHRFPHLDILLRFDAQQFLNVISTCADTPVFSQCDGRLKRLVDVLISMCIECSGHISEYDEKNDPRKKELGPLLVMFVNGLLQKSSIPKDTFLFITLIERVLQQGFPNNRAQKTTEQHIVELLRIVPEIDLDRVLQTAELRPYVHICAYVFTIRKQYIRLLECCLKDPIEPLNIFPILSDLLYTLRDYKEQEEIRLFVRQQLIRLSLLDAQQCAELVLGNFPEILQQCRLTPRKLPFPFLKACFHLRRKQGYHTLTGGEVEMDELLFDYFFEETIKHEKSSASELTGNAADLHSIDIQLEDELRYWLPLGALTDYCLNVSMQQPNGLLLECSAILLVARGHIARAFEHLFNEGILKVRSQERCVASLLELANMHSEVCRAGKWLPKLFRHFLNSTSNSLDNGKTNVEAIHAQLLCPNSHLSRVFTAIMEQPEDDDNVDIDGEKKPASNDKQIAEFPMVSLIGELFSHPAFRDAPFHVFGDLLRQMLLWCEIRTLMQKCTRDCVGWELTERWSKAWKKGAFALSIASRPAASRTAFNNVDENKEEDPYQQQQHWCQCCGQRIGNKSCFLFPCGHCTHLECMDESANKQQEEEIHQQQRQFESSNDEWCTAEAAVGVARRAKKQCPCGAGVQQSSLLTSFCVQNNINIVELFEKQHHQHHTAPSKRTSINEQDRQTISALFQRVEPLRMGPPPPPALTKLKTSSREQQQTQQPHHYQQQQQQFVFASSLS